MCLAIPVQVTELLPDDMAKVSLDGVTKVVSTALVEDLKVGDYVVLHVGYALVEDRPGRGRAHARAVRFGGRGGMRTSAFSPPSWPGLTRPSRRRLAQELQRPLAPSPSRPGWPGQARP